MGIRWGRTKVYLALGGTDLRKQINGLTILVQQQMLQDPFDESLYVFCNRRRNLIKIVYWDRNGFAMWQRRLEKHRFLWPCSSEEVIRIGVAQLEWLLAGLDIQQAHKRLRYRTVV